MSSVSKYLLDLLKRTLSTPGLKKTPQIDLVYTCNTKNQNIARSVQSYLLILYTQEYFAWLLEISLKTIQRIFFEFDLKKEVLDFQILVMQD